MKNTANKEHQEISLTCTVKREIYLLTLLFGQNDLSPLHPMLKCELEKDSVQHNVVLSATKKKEKKIVLLST